MLLFLFYVTPGALLSVLVGRNKYPDKQKDLSRKRERKCIEYSEELLEPTTNMLFSVAGGFISKRVGPDAGRIVRSNACYERSMLSLLGVRNGTTIKVILKKDVNKIGTQGDLVDVRRGFARNFLIPNQLAGLSFFVNIILQPLLLRICSICHGPKSSKIE